MALNYYPPRFSLLDYTVLLSIFAGPVIAACLSLTLLFVEKNVNKRRVLWSILILTIAIVAVILQAGSIMPGLK